MYEVVLEGLISFIPLDLMDRILSTPMIVAGVILMLADQLVDVDCEGRYEGEFHYRVRAAEREYTTSSRAWRFSLESRNLLDHSYRVSGFDYRGPPINASNSVGGVAQIGYYGPPWRYQAIAQFRY